MTALESVIASEFAGPPVRVLQVVRPAQGGIRRHVVNLLDGLDPARVTLSVAAPPAFVGDILHHPNLLATIPLDVAARLSPPRDLLAARRLARVRPQFADVVHAHGVRAAWVAALARRGGRFPLVWTAHNQIGLGPSSRLAVSFIGSRCARVLAVSPSVADSLAACGVPRAKIQVVPNGIGWGGFVPAAEARAEARAALGLSESAFVVAAAARLSPEKGLDVLLRAAAQRAGMTFLLAGDGPQRAALAKDLPANVRLLGHLDDTRPLLWAADVFAVPSRREGQGMAALEAMAAGLPVAASRVGGLADMLTDGETALLVPPDDPDALAAALSRLQTAPRLRQKLAERAAPLVRERYDLRAMLESLTEVYAEVSEEAGSGIMGEKRPSPAVK